MEIYTKFVKAPNLPTDKVGAVIIGERYATKLAPAFGRLNIDVIALSSSAVLEPGVADHADMLFIHIEDNCAVISKSAEGEKLRLEKLGFEVTIAERIQKSNYPLDIGLNTLIIGDKAFCSVKYTEPAVLRELHKRNIKIIGVRQGYAKCSVCVIDSCSAITADKSIYGAMISNAIDTLLIQPGHIALPGYEYGFIGGACGKLSHDRLAFTGKLDAHPDADRIFEFMRSRGVEPVFLTDEICFDIGSIIPVAIK